MARRATAVVLVLLALTVLCALPAAAALQAKITYSPYGTWGGELDVTSSLRSWGSTAPPATPGASFVTFCAEYGQEIGNNEVVDIASIGDRVNGSGALLTPGAAYLFYRFSTQALGGYHYGGPFADRYADADSLQYAIWDLMGYGHPRGWSPQADTWRQEALNSGWTGTDGVRIMNLVNPVTRLGRQDTFVLTPEPGSIALLACGAAGLLPLMRRRKKLA
jgi:hypothetical protein